jgi:hypothetical protein
MTDITRFKAIFSGLDIAYGTYKIEGSRGDGKQAGKAVVVRKPPTDDLWEKHLTGVEPSLGIIPIRADNSCIWGCIDIDQYPLDHAGLVKKIKSLELASCCLSQQVWWRACLLVYQGADCCCTHAGVSEGFCRIAGRSRARNLPEAS